MSLQRVLETARKTGTPVILTDVAGREPLVILPLEQFEAMAGVGVDTGKHQSSVRGQESGYSPKKPHTETVDEAFAEMAAERLKSRVEDVAVQIESLVEQGGEKPEIPLEERFYLEPVDDKGTA
ncbi:hypothetical protein L0Y59_04685 [Candidatus Uhrbacteria bacterium]|nr:hypothetical protein [Candidatus Uhrbacteria bacterium]